MMSRGARARLLATAVAALAAGCAATDTPTADPEAQYLDPPVVIIDEPEPQPQAEPASAQEQAAAPQAVAKDPSTEVITFVGAEAEASMTDEITAAPKRDPLPSMMSDVLHGPNK